MESYPTRKQIDCQVPFPRLSGGGDRFLLLGKEIDLKLGKEIDLKLGSWLGACLSGYTGESRPPGITSTDLKTRDGDSATLVEQIVKTEVLEVDHKIG